MNSFFINLIPIGKSNWKPFVKNIAETVQFSQDESEYIKERYYGDIEVVINEEFENHIVDFLPSASIKTIDNVKFRMIVNRPLYNIDHEQNSKIMHTPWVEESLIYRDALWLSINQTINHHTDYTIILEPNKTTTEYNTNIELIKRICKNSNKKYMVVGENVCMDYVDVYNMFNKGEI